MIIKQLHSESEFFTNINGIFYILVQDKIMILHYRRDETRK